MRTMEKNFNGKTGQSDVIKIPVKDPRTASTVANYVNVILDFTDFNPPTGFVVIKIPERVTGGITKHKPTLTHVLIAEDVRKEFVSLMTRKNNDEKLTCEEIKTLEAYAALLNSTPHMGAQQATDTYPDYILGKSQIQKKQIEQKESWRNRRSTYSNSNYY